MGEKKKNEEIYIEVEVIQRAGLGLTLGFILKGRCSYIRVRRLSLALSEHGGRARICGWISEQSWTLSIGPIL